MNKKKITPELNTETLPTVEVKGKPTYPCLAHEILEDKIFGPRVLKRLNHLLMAHPNGLSESGHDWYFGYLVCAYTQTHYGVKNLLNYPSVTKELFVLCTQQVA
ncbi:hypothetical protein [Leuconostoc citreum]|uniref:hypothetical protein n=1 Tax=Leuconostoc citreum TaxID=33964 RepID=UPI00211B523C|nr:hypothetical protein [Leuconostoc citreum]MCQ6659743.1 hypothetical protein [Leuconostoc citreum]